MCAGQPCTFVVVTTGAGSGTLNVMVEGPVKVAIVCTEVDEGYEFSYTPTAPGDYFIVIKYCNVTIAGCPHKAVITGYRLCRECCSRCRFQPCDCVIARFVEYIQSTSKFC